MSALQSTPGPWTSDGRVEAWRNGDWPGCMVRFWDGDTGHPIANCDLNSKTQSQAIANARLIATAPTLYKEGESASLTLREMAKVLRSVDRNGCAAICDGAADRLDVVLAEARGEL